MILLLLAAVAAAAEVLGVDDVFASVLATHPLLAAQQLRVDGAEGERLAANGAFDPTLSGAASQKLGKYETQSASASAPLGTGWGGKVEVGWQRGVGEFSPYEGALETAPSGEWLASAALPLLRDGWTDRRRASLRGARLGVDVAGAELDQRALELLRGAGQRWIDWVAAGQRLAVARRMVEVARARDDAYAAQEALGEVSAFQRLDNARLLVEREDRLVAAGRAFDQASIELSTWLRDPSGRAVRAREDVLPAALEPEPLPAMDDPIAVAIDRRPELRRLAAQAAQQDVERRLQANQALPGVALVGKLAAPLDPADKDELVVGIATDWAVPARAARGRLAAADAALARLAEERRFLVDRVTADVTDALSAAEAAAARVEVTTRLVDVARRVEAGERDRFALGDSNLIFVNQRELATADAELARVDAVAATHRAALDLRWATGTLADR